MRWIRRLWPQKVRTKLTLIYAALFLAGGSLLLGLTYGLLAASLPTQAQTAGKPPMPLADYIKLCKSPGAAVPPGKQASTSRRKASSGSPLKPRSRSSAARSAPTWLAATPLRRNSGSVHWPTFSCSLSSAWES